MRTVDRAPIVAGTSRLILLSHGPAYLPGGGGLTYRLQPPADRVLPCARRRLAVFEGPAARSRVSVAQRCASDGSCFTMSR